MDFNKFEYAIRQSMKMQSEVRKLRQPSYNFINMDNNTPTQVNAVDEKKIIELDVTLISDKKHDEKDIVLQIMGILGQYDTEATILICCQSKQQLSTDIVDKDELGKLFDNNSDCYADTGRFENDGSWTEGDTIQAITKEKFIEIFQASIQTKQKHFTIEDVKDAFDAGAIYEGAEWAKQEYMNPNNNPNKEQYINSLLK